jgi:hypothetical protein
VVGGCVVGGSVVGGCVVGGCVVGGCVLGTYLTTNFPVGCVTRGCIVAPAITMPPTRPTTINKVNFGVIPLFIFHHSLSLFPDTLTQRHICHKYFLFDVGGK